LKHILGHPKRLQASHNQLGDAGRRPRHPGGEEIATAIGFILWTAIPTWLPAGPASPNMFAIPVIALVSSMLVFGERLAGSENSVSPLAHFGDPTPLQTFAVQEARRIARRRVVIKHPKYEPLPPELAALFEAGK